jgi:hypothetical protein
MSVARWRWMPTGERQKHRCTRGRNSPAATAVETAGNGTLSNSDALSRATIFMVQLIRSLLHGVAIAGSGWNERTTLPLLRNPDSHRHR